MRSIVFNTIELYNMIFEMLVKFHNVGNLSIFNANLQDTLAAWEALQRYSVKKDTSRDTHLAITVEPLIDAPPQRLLNYPYQVESGEEIPSHTFYITEKNQLELQSEPVSPSWGSARVRAKGKGWAVLQLTANYHVTNEHQLQVPPVRAFTITTKAWPSSDTSIQVMILYLHHMQIIVRKFLLFIVYL